MCIYYSLDNLTYKAEEHIFPAAIGGQQCLTKGIVSDQFNTDFSRLEQDLVRNGMPSVVRVIEGPGKRGSHNPNKATKSKVTAIVNREINSNVALGYISLGKAIEIPHIFLNIKTGEITFSTNKAEFNGEMAIRDFIIKCLNPEHLKLRIFESNEIPEDLVLFGIASGVEENYNAFFCRNSTSSEKINNERIKLIGRSLSNVDLSTAQVATYFPKLNLSSTFNLEHLRVYGKIAFNTLCFIKGEKFVSQPNFDIVRNWITKGTSFEGAALNSGFSNISDSLSLPDSCHSVILTKNEHGLVAQVNLYANLGVYIILDPKYKTPFSLDGFICDWKNKREYRFMDYLMQFVLV